VELVISRLVYVPAVTGKPDPSETADNPEMTGAEPDPMTVAEDNPWRADPKYFNPAKQEVIHNRPAESNRNGIV